MVKYTFIANTKKYNYFSTAGYTDSPTSIDVISGFPINSMGFRLKVVDVEVDNITYKLHRTDKETGKTEGANIYIGLNAYPSDKYFVTGWKPE